MVNGRRIPDEYSGEREQDPRLVRCDKNRLFLCRWKLGSARMPDDHARNDTHLSIVDSIKEYCKFHSLSAEKRSELCCAPVQAVQSFTVRRID